MIDVSIESVCRGLLVKLLIALDHADFDTAVECFAIDAIWQRHGTSLKGREEIRSAIAKRSPTVVQRHLLSNVLIESTGPGVAEGTAYVSLYRTDPGEKKLPVTICGPDGIGEYKTIFRLYDEGWRIVEHEGWPVLTITGQAAR